MYSKEVIENFMNPKNMGEIENADGIGKVGNPVCLLPKEKIFLNDKFEDIEKSKEKEYVISHKGIKNEINDISSRKYKGKIIKLKNNLGEVQLTPEHLVYAINIPKKDKFKRNEGKLLLTPSWYHAEHLKKGDIILYPIPNEIKNIKYIDINIQKLKYDFRSKEIPKKILLNSEILRLFGYYLSEGSISEKPSKNYISFTLHIDEKDIVDDISNISKKLFNLKVKITEKPERKTVIVDLYSAQLSRFFKKLFGKGAQNKSIPEIIMLLPPEKQKSLIKGLWKGDGYVNLNRNGPRAGYTTISYQLSQQIKFLLLRQKIVPSIYIDKAHKSKGVNHKKAFRIHIGQMDSLKKLCNILGIQYKPKSHESIKSWFDNNFLYTPITKIERKNYNGKVHNLEVEENHSYISEAFCLHNCGDVMHLYIKIDKKDGKEILKDVKFKTFGCAAAIATSSMITQLAKGKTLEEAGKINREMIIDKLKGLPPVKIHCSILADKALAKAIEDYKKKNEINPNIKEK